MGAAWLQHSGGGAAHVRAAGAARSAVHTPGPEHAPHLWCHAHAQRPAGTGRELRGHVCRHCHAHCVTQRDPGRPPQQRERHQRVRAVGRGVAHGQQLCARLRAGARVCECACARGCAGDRARVAQQQRAAPARHLRTPTRTPTCPSRKLANSGSSATSTPSLLPFSAPAPCGRGQPEPSGDGVAGAVGAAEHSSSG